MFSFRPVLNSRLLFSGIILGVFALTAEAAFAGETVRLSPGDNIQKAVDANPKGTSFMLLPGVYRMQQILPKDGDSFTGKDKVTLNGSEVLTFSADSSQRKLWVATATASTINRGTCEKLTPLCGFTQDLFLDSQLQTPVGSQAELAPGTWYFDRKNNKVYIDQDPTGHTVEIGMAEFAFGGNATGVQVQFMTVEKYANGAQEGVIGGNRWSPGLGARWTVSNAEVRWNHGTGIGLGTESKILKSYVHHNGQLGVAFYNGTNCVISNTEVSWNNYAGYATGWEAGGSKFWSTTNLAVQYNFVHDNYGPGLWTDYDNTGTLYEHNTVVNNFNAGIKHEISYNAIIRYNTLKGNGAGAPQWLGSAQILDENSPNVEIYGNVLEVPSARGGIALINGAGRGSGNLGPWVAAHIFAHNNTITYLGVKGVSGLEDDAGNNTAVDNRLDYNQYYGAANFWVWPSPSRIDWRTFQAVGQEAHGKCCK